MRSFKLGLLMLLALALAAKGPKIAKVKPPTAAKYKVAKYKDAKPAKTRKIPKFEQDRTSFMQKNPCPSTGKTKGPCPGYVLDHSIDIPDDGKDPVVNMSWKPKE